MEKILNDLEVIEETQCGVFKLIATRKQICYQ